MLNRNFKRLIRLAKRTNSPLIVTDADGEDPVVLMSVDQFEALASEFDPADYDCFEDFEDEIWDNDDIDLALDDDEIEEIEQDFMAPVPEDEIFAGEIADEELDEAENTAENGSEEQFYLEPIE